MCVFVQADSWTVSKGANGARTVERATTLIQIEFITKIYGGRLLINYCCGTGYEHKGSFIYDGSRTFFYTDDMTTTLAPAWEHYWNQFMLWLLPSADIDALGSSS